MYIINKLHGSRHRLMGVNDIKITKITKKNYETIGLNIYYINPNLTKIKSTLEII